MNLTETATSSGLEGGLKLEIFNGIGIGLIVLGVIVLLLGRLGMCGACCTVRCMLITVSTL